MKTKTYCSSLQILAAGICWGCIGLFSRTLLNAGIGAANVVVLRNLGSLLVLLAVFAVKDRSVFHIRLRHLPIFFGTRRYQRGAVYPVLFPVSGAVLSGSQRHSALYGPRPWWSS